MAKLYFRYGTVDCAKTMNLLAVAHNYRSQGKRVVLIKPRIDTRFGEQLIRSRVGLEAKADLIVDEGSDIPLELAASADCILVDEAQFLPPSIVDGLRRITVDPGVPVICYGLRSDFQTQLFPGAQRLFELADRIEEVKVTCQFCRNKAICNLRVHDGVPVTEGPQVLLGGNDTYMPVCWKHYDDCIRSGRLPEPSRRPNQPL